VARVIHRTLEDAELALARLKVADHEKRLPTGGTAARSVAAALQLYQRAADLGQIELAPSTVLMVRGAVNLLSNVELPNGQRFGDIRLSRLTWQDIEHLYAAMRARGSGAAHIRRNATILAQALELPRKRGLIDANPSKDVCDRSSPGDARRYLDTCPPPGRSTDPQPEVFVRWQ